MGKIPRGKLSVSGALVEAARGRRDGHASAAESPAGREVDKKHVLVMALGCLTLGLAAPASAQEEIVVTGARLKEYDPNETPHVTLAKRADNLIVRVTVVCDTRDLSQRREELKATLRNMIRAAAADTSVELGLGDEIVGRFDETMLDAVISPRARPDSSQAIVVIKTAVAAGDTFDGASGRIKRFIERTPTVGRSEILLTGDWQLTLVDPGQYRPGVARLVAEDAARMAAMFGAGYGVEVEDLQLPVSWYQSGPLDLALYIPYTLVVRPLGR